MSGENWAVVLAAGEGRRLRPLTPTVPKQFCRLHDGPSLLGLALRRAAGVVPSERVAAIVASGHERFWTRERDLAGIGCLVAQPEDRGTGTGVLLALLHVLERDPAARVLFLPSDHFVADEVRLARAMRLALERRREEGDALVLVGVVPDDPDAELGWIVPGPRGPHPTRTVERFVEKPPREVARELMTRGGLWNSFIFAARGSSLLEHARARRPEVVFGLESALTSGARVEALALVYRELENFDFSSDLLEGLEGALSVVTVEDCGWSDLGTPDRVARCVDSLPRAASAESGAGPGVDLAEALRAWTQRSVLSGVGSSRTT